MSVLISSFFIGSPLGEILYTVVVLTGEGESVSAPRVWRPTVCMLIMGEDTSYCCLTKVEFASWTCWPDIIPTGGANVCWVYRGWKLFPCAVYKAWLTLLRLWEALVTDGFYLGRLAEFAAIPVIRDYGTKLFSGNVPGLAYYDAAFVILN